MASENIVELNDSNFDNEVSKISEPLLVDFWAPWCAPCRMLDPVVGEIARENAGKFAIAKVNVDESPGVSEKFGVRSIPTLLFFKAGEKRDQTVGVLGKAEIVRRLQALG
jgi:thioredoxin 1